MVLWEVVVPKPPLSQAFPVSVTQVGPGKQNISKDYITKIHSSNSWDKSETHSALSVSKDTQIPKALGSGSAFGISSANASAQLILRCRKNTTTSLCGHWHVVMSCCNPPNQSRTDVLQEGLAARYNEKIIIRNRDNIDFTTLGKKKSPKHLIRGMRFEAALRVISYYTEHLNTLTWFSRILPQRF